MYGSLAYRDARQELREIGGDHFPAYCSEELIE